MIYEIETTIFNKHYPEISGSVFHREKDATTTYVKICGKRSENFVTEYFSKRGVILKPAEGDVE